jgi:hypothetical protein
MSGRFHRVLALGVALAALSCSDPVPPAYKAGLRVNVTSIGGGTLRCPTSAATQQIGEPGPDWMVTGSKGGLIFDGEKGVKTSCTVAGGPQFNVATSIAGGGMSFNLSGSVSSAGTGTATISLYNSDLAGQFSSPPGGCTVTAVQTAQGHQIKAGAMWATFNCPTITGQIATDGCRLQGEVVIENCD